MDMVYMCVYMQTYRQNISSCTLKRSVCCLETWCQAMLEAEKIVLSVNPSADGTLPMGPDEVED